MCKGPEVRTSMAVEGRVSGTQSRAHAQRGQKRWMEHKGHVVSEMAFEQK